MIAGGHGVGDTQCVAEERPDLRCKLHSSVSCDVGRHTKPGNPALHQGICTGPGRCRLERNSLQPSGGSVNDGEDVCVALLGGWQRSHQVKMDVAEPPARDGDGLQRSSRLLGNLAPLACLAVPAPGSNIRVHAWPHKPGCQQSAGCSRARVSHVVARLKYSPSVAGRHDRSPNPPRDVSKQAGSLNLLLQ